MKHTKKPPKFSVNLMIEEGNYLTGLGTISFLDEESEWVDYEYCDTWRFDNGKLAEVKAFVFISRYMGRIWDLYTKK